MTRSPVASTTRGGDGVLLVPVADLGVTIADLHDGQDHTGTHLGRVPAHRHYPALANCLVGHTDARGAVLPTDDLLRYRNGQSLATRRYDHLWKRLGDRLPWIAAQSISAHCHIHLGRTPPRIRHRMHPRRPHRQPPQPTTIFSLDTIGTEAVAAETSLLVPPTVPKLAEGPVLEEVALVRDETANLV